MNPAARVPRLVLALYPRTFRDQFGDQWLADVDGRLGWTAGRTERLRVYWLICRDALRAVPAAYLQAGLMRARRAGARLRARLAFGGPGSFGGGPRSFEVLRLDLRVALRALWREPSFTVTAILSLALGIGAATAMYTVVNTVLLQPLPYRDADRLAMAWNNPSSMDRTRLPFSGVELDALRQAPELFEEVGAIWATSAAAFGTEGPETIPVGLVTDNFFDVLGISPALGRVFADNEQGPGRSGVVLLSDAYWRRSFGADPGVIGSTLRLNAAEAVIIGVLPADFTLRLPHDAGVPSDLELYQPFRWDVSAGVPDLHYLRVVGRLRPEVTWEQASAQVSAVAAQVRERYAELEATGDEFTVAHLQTDAVGSVRPVLIALFIGVGLFLLLAAGNVANLLLARMNARSREMAIRTCLGATRGRIVRQLLTESVVVAAGGAALGVAWAWWGTEALWSMRPEGLRAVAVVSLDASVLVFSLAVTALAWALFSLMLLLHLRSDPAPVLWTRGSTPRSQRLRKLVIVGEVAIGLVLVIGASLMSQTIARLHRVDMGFDPAQLVTARVSLSRQLFPTDAQRAGLAQEVERVLGNLPGVGAAGGVSHLPLAKWANWSDAAAPEGVAEAERNSYHADHRSVTPGYFSTAGTRLVSGRVFTVHDDGAAQPVIVIDETMAARAFGDRDPIGRLLTASRYIDGSFVPTPAMVVGVVADTRDRGPGTPSSGQVFWPFAQSARWEMSYVIQSEAPAALMDRVRPAVAGVHGDLAVSDVRPLSDLVGAATEDTKFTALLAALFAGLALVLAAVGLYGVMAYSAEQRTKEIGIRVALGARRGAIFRRMLGEGLSLGSFGVIIGVVAGVAVTRYLSALLFGVSPTDPATFIVAAAVLLSVCLVASVVPAGRATRVDPMTTLRLE